MLKLTDVRKAYKTVDFTQTALDGVSVAFRDNEFAAILGPSGSGKTTLLNIIGGLDHYDDGDLEIDGISTKQYKDSDWDTYRNNRIGFVFQSYNLIPHQTVLANVELALTLSGVSRSQREERAKKALADVGLADHIRKLPSQLSGGQMQRVAIARALINDPEILLADEPTGALDTTTSEQVMDLLTKIAKDRLVIMVTHNNELAEDYANRIIELKDGQIQTDTNPFDPEKEEQRSGRAARKVSMSFFTAVALSFSNLLTKKGRTFVISLAGSIGIIGIAAILALASGINAYIKNTEEETMSIYPLTIQETGLDFSSFLGDGDETAAVTVDSTAESSTEVSSAGLREQKIVETLFNYRSQNDLASLKTYLDDHQSQLTDYVKNVQYIYNITPQIYLADTQAGVNQVNPDTLLNSFLGTSSNLSSMFGFGSGSGMNVFHEMPGEIDMFSDQYDVRAGRWPQAADEAVLVVGRNDQISDYILYTLGLRNRDELKRMLEIFANEPDADIDIEEAGPFDYQDLMAAKLKVVNPAARYVHDETYNIWLDRSENADYMKELLNDSMELKIVGVVRAQQDASATSLSMGINYMPELITQLMEDAAKEPIIQQQMANPEVNVFSGKTFLEENEESQNAAIEFSDFITVDESKIQEAFNIDSSKINLDFSNLGAFSVDLNSIAAPEIDLTQLTQSLEGQISIPTDQLTGVIVTVLQNFLAEEIANGVTDFEQMAQDLPAYLAREDVQSMITENLNQILDVSQLNNQINSALQSYIQTTLSSYVTQVMSSLQTQLTTQIQNQTANLLAQLPQQIQNAITIDQTAIASAFQLNMSEDDILELMNTIMNPIQSTYEQNLQRLGYADPAAPAQINLYSLDFNAKAEVENFLQTYNRQVEADGEKEKVIRYTDLVGTMMSSVTDIVDTISYALVAFVSISLVVSSIMIGVITYISVLERKKEIGILRAIGASKRDIRRVFNAETLIIGFIAGLIGVTVTYLLSIVANLIVYERMGIENIAQLPIEAALILIGISMLLAFISGLFPSSAAARKDPVEALRSE
ncbi:ATP-binding cassette domain-containing protein [Enterococcus sp. LJL120]